MKRAIIVGATSGIGQEIAKVLLAQGWKIGIAGRRKELLTAFQERNPEQIATQALDVTQKDAVLKLNGLIIPSVTALCEILGKSFSILKYSIMSPKTFLQGNTCFFSRPTGKLRQNCLHCCTYGSILFSPVHRPVPVQEDFH